MINRIGLMKVRTNINNMDAAFTLATNVDVEVTMLMGIELRNEYLKIHPEIDPMLE